LAKLTSIEKPALIKIKNMEALKILLEFGHTEANYLFDDWVHILRVWKKKKKNC
jgi:hypothetical protein